jgi:integrase/recombinase XerD
MTSPSHLAKSLGENDLFEYINIIELSGITEKHTKETKRALEKYLDYVNWTGDKTKSLAYFKQLQSKFSIAYYKKQMYQIMKFLKHHGAEWVKEIKLPPDPDYTPKRVTDEDIARAIDYFIDNDYYKRFKAIILLGATSGLRPSELYALTLNDIDLNNRTIYVRHDPKSNHTTKSGKSRISFFNEQASVALVEYLEVFDNGGRLKTLFSENTMQEAFQNAPMRIKHLRKAFSQEWTRKGGDAGIKKILMGHSLKNDVDLMHYNAQSPDDLKQIYDKVMCGTT